MPLKRLLQNGSKAMNLEEWIEYSSKTMKANPKQRDTFFITELFNAQTAAYFLDLWDSNS